MGEFILALLVTGIAAAGEGRYVQQGAQRRLKAAYMIVALLGLALTLAAALGFSDRVLAAAAGWIGEVLHS